MKGSARSLVEIARDVLQTAFRLAPWPTEPGLRGVGQPGPTSPVIVTGNYDLTVRRVVRALRGHDAWVVVASSRGINVWCAASGGHLTAHQVIAALKTSGIEARVTHRRAVLPQLAATGVLAREVSQRCGWHVRFGPTYAEDLPRYLEGGGRGTEDMRRVRFGLGERLEMAIAWAAPTALLLGGVALALRPAWALAGVGLALAIAAATFLLYDRVPGPRRVLFGIASAALSLLGAALCGATGAALVAVPAAAAGLVYLLTFDYAGSTPIEGGSHFEERRWRISLDPDLCQGVYACLEVCPEGVFEVREGARAVLLARDERCIRCGACVVQCPEDALYFEDPTGRRVGPDVIRRFKLNLLGRRSVDAGGPGKAPPP